MDARSLLAEVLSGVEQHGTLFGAYVLHEKLGRGGHGVVYRARRVGSEETLALKQMRGGSQASEEERREFLAGAETMARLEHPGIVRVLEFGEADGCPFFTMPLVEGADLAVTLEEGRPSQAQAARWVAAVARAVHYAHDRRLLHCDLKPANILVAATGAALVTDFGAARRLSLHGTCDESGSGVVSYYMAPEQALGGTRGLTRRADVYSLGVILYELLTGCVPGEQPVFARWVAALAAPEPVPSPREVEPAVSRHLDLICATCLEKDPGLRYANAALLAEDLDSVLAGWGPIHARPPRAASRSVRWLRGHPLVGGACALAVLFSVALTLALVSLRQSDREQQRAALETNGFIANSQAGALLFALRDFADRIERCAQRPAVAELLTQGESIPDLRGPELCALGAQEVAVFDTEGRMLAEWPPAVLPLIGKNFAFRGYFQGARELALRGRPGAFLTPAYRGESKGQLQIAFASPVRSSGGQWLGVVVSSMPVASAIGDVGLSDASGGGRLVALLGPRGNDRAAAQAPRLDFIAHPRLPHGREVAVVDPTRAIFNLALAAPPGEQFALRWTSPLLLSDYQDPLSDSGSGVLAAFAPVGQTGYVVAIQTSKSAVLTHGRALVTKLVWRVGLPLATGFLLLGFAAFRSVQSKRRLARRPKARPGGADTGVARVVGF